MIRVNVLLFYQFSVCISIDLPTAKLTVQSPTPVYVGEEITLKCDIQPGSVWKYKLFKGRGRNLHSESDSNIFSIREAILSDKGRYQCQGERRNRVTVKSNPSSEITINVKGNHCVHLFLLLTLLCDVLHQGMKVNKNPFRVIVVVIKTQFSSYDKIYIQRTKYKFREHKHHLSVNVNFLHSPAHS